MIYILLILFILALIYGPSLWVKFVLHRYNKTIDEMPGTGGELAQHLIERFKLEGVTLIKGPEQANYYSPDDKTVSIGKEFYDQKSLAAIAVAAHEVSHALQFYHDEPVSHLRKRYMKPAHRIQKVGSILLVILTSFVFIVKLPHLVGLTLLIGVATMLINVLLTMAVLPEEFDASFNKALPILREGYVPEEHIPVIRRILKACALTYVAAALTQLLNLWRWFRFIR